MYHKMLRYFHIIKDIELFNLRLLHKTNFSFNFVLEYLLQYKYCNPYLLLLHY